MKLRSNSSRFVDIGTTFHSYIYEIFVCCPACGLRAMVSKKEPKQLGSSSPSMFQLQVPPRRKRQDIWLIVKVMCGNCAARIDICIPNVKHNKGLRSIRCKECGETNEYKPRFVEAVPYHTPRTMQVDPFFKLPLWLQSEVRGKILWAWNYRHLDYIRHYVQSSLRVRHRHQYSSMVERLPSWITTAKNRLHIVKAIRRLEKK